MINKQEAMEFYKWARPHYGKEHYEYLEKKLDEWNELKENPDECRGCVEASLKYDEIPNHYPWEN